MVVSISLLNKLSFVLLFKVSLVAHNRLSVVCYAATWGTFKTKLKKTLKNPPQKKTFFISAIGTFLEPPAPQELELYWNPPPPHKKKKKNLIKLFVNIWPKKI